MEFKRSIGNKRFSWVNQKMNVTALMYKKIQYALNGLRVGLTDQSFVLEIVVGIIMIPPLSFYFHAQPIFYALLASYCILLVVELLNTAIEMICNKLTLEHDEQIKAIKDVASAAVFIMIALNGILLLALLWEFF